MTGECRQLLFGSTPCPHRGDCSSVIKVVLAAATVGLVSQPYKGVRCKNVEFVLDVYITTSLLALSGESLE